DGSPSVAGGLGAGVILPERGMGSGEARRLLGPGLLMGREVSSAGVAALVEGVDVVVADLDVLGAAALRATIEAGWAATLARVSTPENAAVAMRSGAEGIIVPVDGLTEIAAYGRSIPARTREAREIRLNGVSIPLEPDTAITDLLADTGLEGAGAVRVNGSAVPRRGWDDRLLAPGDVVDTE
ncbi:MAG: sulfur carrier protein ThiS, partial [Thermomicrobiales bacterium]